MSRVSTYLNFMGNTEEAFAFYASVFGTEYSVPIMRFGDMPGGPGAPELPELERSQVLHVELPILAGHVIMGTDMLESMGHELRVATTPPSTSSRTPAKKRIVCMPRFAMAGRIRWGCRRCRGAPTGAPASTSSGSGGCSTWVRFGSKVR